MIMSNYGNANFEPGEVKIVEIAPSVQIALRWCPATTDDTWRQISGGADFFLMGSPNDEKGRFADESRHKVRLTQGFWMGEYQVTQWQWEKLMGSNPSENIDGSNFDWLGFEVKPAPDNPIDCVSWNDCQDYLRKLNSLDSVRGLGLMFALPTEAQWEYACRAGTTGAYGGTGRLNRMGWYKGNSVDWTHKVAEKKPNAWGLHDMHGNVWEWCQDWYGDYPTIIETDLTETDPLGPESGTHRVLRGGDFSSDARSCRSSTRGKNRPNSYGRNGGFRLVAT